MASLFDKRVNDVGANGQNTSPDNEQKDDSANKKATCEGNLRSGSTMEA